MDRSACPVARSGEAAGRASARRRHSRRSRSARRRRFDGASDRMDRGREYAQGLPEGPSYRHHLRRGIRLHPDRGRQAQRRRAERLLHRRHQAEGPGVHRLLCAFRQDGFKGNAGDRGRDLLRPARGRLDQGDIQLHHPVFLGVPDRGLIVSPGKHPRPSGHRRHRRGGIPPRCLRRSRCRVGPADLGRQDPHHLVS